MQQDYLYLISLYSIGLYQGLIDIVDSHYLFSCDLLSYDIKKELSSKL